MKAIITAFCLAAAGISLGQGPADVGKSLNDKLAAAHSLQATMSVTFPGGTPQVWKVELLKPNLYKVISPDQQFRSDGKVESTFVVPTKKYQYSDRTGTQITDAPFIFGLNAFFPGFTALPSTPGVLTKLDEKAAYAMSIQEPGFVSPTTLYVDVATNLPLGYDEPLSTTSAIRVRYTQIKLNPALEGSSFQWTPPAGAKAAASQDLESKLLKSGSDAPILEVRDLKGINVDLATLYASYRTTLLYFWNGPPPYSDLASLQQLAAGLAGQRFQIVIVDSNVTADIANKQLAGIAIPFPVVTDPAGTLAKAYGVGATSEFIVGSDGKIGGHFLGYDPDGITKALRQRGFRI